MPWKAALRLDETNILVLICVTVVATEVDERLSNNLLDTLQTVTPEQLHAGESGLLARLLIPLAAALSPTAVSISGEKSLLGRPLAGAHELMAAFGVTLQSQSERPMPRKVDCLVPLTVKGPLIPGRAEISGKENEITPDTVRFVCSVSAADEVPFALTDAMQKWTIGGMISAITQSKDMREEPIAVVSKMGRTYTDMLLIKSAMNAGLSAAEISKKIKMNAYRVEKYVGSLVRVPISVI